MLKDITPPTFNSNRVLSRALLALFKAYIVVLEEETWMDRIAQFARRAEAIDNVPDHSMMEQLREVYRTRLSISPWSHSSFLSYAVRTGLLYFLASTLDRDPKIINSCEPDLVRAALRMDNLEGPYGFDPTPIFHCCSSEAHFLRINKAIPNFSGHTGWRGSRMVIIQARGHNGSKY